MSVAQTVTRDIADVALLSGSLLIGDECFGAICQEAGLPAGVLNIVLDDCDIDATLTTAIRITSPAGQVCLASTRMLVHDAVNDELPVGGPLSPVGGVKDSGYGKEGGRAGIMEYLRVKNVSLNLAVR